MDGGCLRAKKILLSELRIQEYRTLRGGAVYRTPLGSGRAWRAQSRTTIQYKAVPVLTVPVYLLPYLQLPLALVFKSILLTSGHMAACISCRKHNRRSATL